MRIFSVDATGQGLSYQWYESTDDGTTGMTSVMWDYTLDTSSPNLTIFNVDRDYDGNMYRVVITGTCGVPANPMMWS